MKQIIQATHQTWSFCHLMFCLEVKLSAPNPSWHRKTIIYWTVYLERLRSGFTHGSRQGQMMSRESDLSLFLSALSGAWVWTPSPAQPSSGSTWGSRPSRFRCRMLRIFSIGSYKALSPILIGPALVMCPCLSQSWWPVWRMVCLVQPSTGPGPRELKLLQDKSVHHNYLLEA